MPPNSAGSLPLLLALLLVAAFPDLSRSACDEQILFEYAHAPTVGWNPRSIAAGDFNEDGIADLAVTTSYYLVNNGMGSNVSILIGRGDGTFAQPVKYFVGPVPFGVAVGDFDEDGIQDLAVTVIHSDNIAILRGLGSAGMGNGSFAPPRFYYAGDRPFNVITGDFDEDGITDLAVSGNGLDPAVRILRGQGGGGVGNGAFTLITTCPLREISCGIASGDFNEDGITDLVATEAILYWGYSVGVLIGLGSGGVGNGSFAPAVHYDSGREPFAIAVADLDDDGIQDLAIANQNDGGVTIQFGKGTSGIGNGTFGPWSVPVRNSSGNTAAIAIGDYNGDARPDLAVCYTNYFVRIFLNRGRDATRNGRFEQPRDYMVGNTPASIAEADFNGDARLDLAVANFLQEEVSILRATCLLGSPDPRYPVITDVRDAPDDQGKKVVIRWNASSLDASGGTVTEYHVWREFVPPDDWDGRQDVAIGASPIRVSGGEYWEPVAYVPAQRLDEYALTVETVRDSTAAGNPYTAFYVTAQTANFHEFYDSEIDSGYSVDNLPPQTPRSFTGVYEEHGTTLQWLANDEPDLRAYRLYRGLAADFAPSSQNLLAETTETHYFDPIAYAYYYKLSAIDVHGNEGGHALVTPDGPVSTVASLVSATASGSRVTVVWQVANSRERVRVHRAWGGDWAFMAEVQVDGTGMVTFEDDDVVPGRTYHYRIGIDDQGVEVFAGEVAVAVPALEFAIHGVRPNPMPQGGHAMIAFTLAEAGPANLEIVDTAGRRVASRRLEFSPGDHTLRLDSIARLKPGMYLVRITQDGRTAVAKTIVLR